jgi:hypothetical protein
VLGSETEVEDKRRKVKARTAAGDTAGASRKGATPQRRRADIGTTTCLTSFLRRLRRRLHSWQDGVA